MSGSDVFIHTCFFQHPDMVAYVLDPVSGKEGFFCWRDGSVGLCPSYGLVGAPEEILEPRGKKKRARWGPVKWVIGALLIGALSYGVVSFHPRHSTAPPSKSVVRIVPAAEKPKLYSLAKGENLWSVSHRVYGNGGLGSALARYNGVKTFVRLQIGQQIELPPKDVLEKMAEHSEARGRQR